MKKFIAVLMIAMIIGVVGSEVNAKGYRNRYTSRSSVRVRGYTKRSTGTYVMSHRRTALDGYKINNWSTKGNMNPYTGKKGTVNPTKKLLPNLKNY